MKAFTLTPDLNVTAYASRKAAIASGHASFGSVDELDTLLTSLNIKPVDLWNSMPGLIPVKKFMNRKAGLARIWKQLDGLAVAPEVIESEPDEKPAKKARKVKAEQTASVATETAHTPREGSKGAEVADMLRRANGATLDEIMQATGWQKHTVRGFIAGAAKKKLGLNIESFKNQNGDRSYKVVA